MAIDAGSVNIHTLKKATPKRQVAEFWLDTFLSYVVVIIFT